MFYLVWSPNYRRTLSILSNFWVCENIVYSKFHRFYSIFRLCSLYSEKQFQISNHNFFQVYNLFLQIKKLNVSLKVIATQENDSIRQMKKE